MRAISLSSQARTIGSVASGNANAGMKLAVKPVKVSLSEPSLEVPNNGELVGGFNKFVIKGGFVEQ